MLTENLITPTKQKQQNREILATIALFYPFIMFDLYFAYDIKNCNPNNELIDVKLYLLISGCLNALWSTYLIYSIWNLKDIYNLNLPFVFYMVYHLFYVSWIVIGMFVLSSILNTYCDINVSNYLFIKITSTCMYYLIKFIIYIGD